MANPLAQFQIKTIIPIEIAGIDVSFTNSSLFMLVALLCIVAFFSFSLRKAEMFPSRVQAVSEMLYGLVAGMLDESAGPGAKKFMPLVFSLFLFVLLCNILGMIPYSFTVTSHIIVTFVLAMLVFLTVTIYGFYKHGTKFLSLFLPHGTPWWLAPLMILIELIAFLARPISLSLRLTANMVAGHVMLKIIGSFVISLFIVMKPLPVPLIIILIGFEIFVALLQAYIFTILSCVYLGDAVNLH